MADINLSSYAAKDTNLRGSADSGNTPVANGSDGNGAVWNTLLNNLGDYLGGGANLLNAINGKPNVVVANPTNKPTPTVGGVPTMWLIIGIVFILIVIFLFTRK